MTPTHNRSYQNAPETAAARGKRQGTRKSNQSNQSSKAAAATDNIFCAPSDIFCPPLAWASASASLTAAVKQEPATKVSKNARRSADKQKSRQARLDDAVGATKQAPPDDGDDNGKNRQQFSNHLRGGEASQVERNPRKKNSNNNNNHSKGQGENDLRKRTNQQQNSSSSPATKKHRTNDKRGKGTDAQANRGKLSYSQKEDRKKQKEEAKKKNSDRVHFRPSKPVDGPSKVLVWNSSLDYIPLRNEEAMQKMVFLGKHNEHGMLEHAPQQRLDNIRVKCEALSMTFLQASSLRSHYIMKHNRFSNARDKLGLLSEAVNREAATIFEDCVAAFLDEQKIPYMDEDEQKRIQPQGSSTPDNLLRETVNLKWKDNAPFEINWVECKMFYAASTIPLDNKSAVGRLMTTAKKYVDKFGPGAIVFASGCGDQIASKLRDVGVIAVDSDAISLKRLDDHRKLHTADPPNSQTYNSNNNHQPREGNRGGGKRSHRHGNRR